MKPVFLTKKKDGCCTVCNPVSLADFECDVIAVNSPVSNARSVQLCRSCIAAFVRSARGARRVTISLHQEVQEFALEKVRKKAGLK
jgi:hypothetical protein